ncbi:hypothetical protein QBC44DRAFT_370669 [Cladorrhinum sp. PSN332]|nr:hypothetical protein QBC44DRAFT_370669 [Cladorrhinum sp. PSN332]
MGAPNGNDSRGNRYVYQPLDDSKDEIRVLSIEPLQADQLVRCNIEKVFLNSYHLDEIASLGAPEEGYFDRFKSTRVDCTSWKSAYGDDQAAAQALYRFLGNTTSGGRKPREKHVTAVSCLPGEAYVEGIMYDKAVELLCDAEYQEMVFTFK